MRRRIKLLVLTLFFCGGLWALFEYERSGECCHAIAHAQSQDEPEEGNPEHKEPMQSCSHTPDKKQVACKCRRQCDGAVENESRACKSYCFRHFCLCKNPPCV